MNSHNAYHIGHIVVIRKAAGNWDPEKERNKVFPPFTVHCSPFACS